MKNPICQQPNDLITDEGILKAVDQKRYADAILMLHQVRQYSLDEAWQMVQLLRDDQPYEKPDDDPEYLLAKEHISGGSTWSENKPFAAIALAFILCGGLLVAWNWRRFHTGIESFWWNEGTATAFNVRHYGRTTYPQGRKVTRHFVDYNYHYIQNGTVYSATVKKRSYNRLFDGDRLKDGQSIAIFYDPNDPSRSIHKRRLYARSIGFVFGILISLPGISMLLFGVCRTWRHRRLSKITCQNVNSKIPAAMY